MSRVMYVTVGTSLFHSATWEAAPELLRKVPSYDAWMTPERLRSPAARQGSDAGALTERKLMAELRPDNAAEWANWLPAVLRAGSPWADTVMRYSAELATIVKLAEHEDEAGSLAGFLRGYERIVLACDPVLRDGRSLSQTAAMHLARYLNAICGEDGRAEVDPIAGLSSDEPQYLLLDEHGGLPLLAKRLRSLAEKHEHLDLVISGGFKIYGIFLAPLLQSAKNRILYIHESGRALMVVTGQDDEVSQEELFRDLRRSVGRMEARY